MEICGNTRSFALRCNVHFSCGVWMYLTFYHRFAAFDVVTGRDFPRLTAMDYWILDPLCSVVCFISMALCFDVL